MNIDYGWILLVGFKGRCIKGRHSRQLSPKGTYGIDDVVHMDVILLPATYNLDIQWLTPRVIILPELFGRPGNIDFRPGRKRVCSNGGRWSEWKNESKSDDKDLTQSLEHDDFT